MSAARVRWAGIAAAAVFVLILPQLLTAGSSFLDSTNTALAYVVMALGLNIVVGFAGLLDLGYVAFFAIGAFSIGWFSSAFLFRANVHVGTSEFSSFDPGIHLNFVLIVIVAMVLCAVAGVLIGLPTLRLRGDYIAIVTLGFGEIIRVFAINGTSLTLFGMPITNGRQGITPIDPVKLPGLREFDQLDLRPWYYLALALVAVVLFCNVRLRDSRQGRAWIALREDETAAVAMGVPAVRTKLLAYGTGAAIGGISGAYLGAYLNTVNADQFEFSFSIFVLAMIILGGLGSIWGVVIGAMALSYINSYVIPDLLRDSPHWIGLSFDLTDLSYGVFGFLLVLMMRMRPQGLLPERRHRMEFEET